MVSENGLEKITSNKSSEFTSSRVLNKDTMQQEDVPLLNLTKYLESNHQNSLTDCNIPFRLELSDEIVTDLYHSICSSVHQIKIHSTDKATMNMKEFTAFFEKCIYSTIKIKDPSQISMFDSNKQFITEQMFEFICNENENQISFKRFINVCNAMHFNQFLDIICPNETRSDCKLESKTASPLGSIEYSKESPLTTPEIIHSSEITPRPKLKIYK